MLLVGQAGLFQHLVERGLFLPLLGGAGPVLRAGIVFGHLHAKLLGQVLHRLDKAHAGVLHQKTDGVAGFAAAKAVVELLGRAD